MLEYALSQLPPGSEVHEVTRVGDDVTWYLETSDGPAWVVTSDAMCIYPAERYPSAEAAHEAHAPHPAHHRQEVGALMPSRLCTHCEPAQLVRLEDWQQHRKVHQPEKDRQRRERTGRRGSTRAWRHIRAQVIARDGHRCRRMLHDGRQCPNTSELEVHHINGQPLDNGYPT
jgi:hypothetical protein